MGYHLQAIVGQQEALTHGAAPFRQARVVPLTQGFALIPLTDELYDEIGDGGEVGRFAKLSPGVETWGRRLSVSASTAYVEAEFFGGIGGQSVVCWANGSRVLGPLHSPTAINEALRLLGVRADGALDEFEAVGLGRHRDTADWGANDAD